MDLIYIILSIYIRLFQTAFPLSCSASMSKSRQDSQQWAMWLPLAGWFTISVRLVPGSVWLNWRVYQIRRMPGSRWDEPHKLEKQKPHHLKPKSAEDLCDYKHRADKV